MGDQVEATEFSGQDRQRYRAKVRRCLDAFAEMLAESRFEFDRPLTGLEIELNLVDGARRPAMRNEEVLRSIADPEFQTELGQFNIEINVPPRQLAGSGADALEAELREGLNEAERRATAVGAHIVMIGILPTLRTDHISAATLSSDPRYGMLEEQILAARGEPVQINIDGPEQLEFSTETIAPESACTSVQFHLQVSPHTYASYWNAAQSVAGVQLALGANSPFLFGKELWRESRIALFQQATDTRPEELKSQGVRPRVWFGERWVTSVFDQFEENVRYFPALLPICDEEDPVSVLASGGTPKLAELRMHNGTIYRWNRPVYDVVDGQAHLRVENRVLPSGPTVVDILANGAFYYGLVRVLAEEDRPVWSRMSFAMAEENFHQAARHGIDAHIFWPGVGEVPAPELVLRRLLPLAHEGLARWGVEVATSDRLLGIIEQRCLAHLNGAAWQVRTVHELQGRGRDRIDALSEMLGRYVEYMHENLPVHAWPVAPDLL